MNKLQEAEFLRDVAEHQMQVLRDDGVYRHIRFSVPGSSVYRFDLLTWPGHLCYTGDMGTFVFSRLNDMFEFFRTDREHAKRRGCQLCINTGYWSEKLLAVDGNRHDAGATEFSEDEFRRVINEYRVRWIRDAANGFTLDKEQRRELWDAVESEVLDRLGDEGEHGAQLAAHRFSWRPESSYGASRGPQWSFGDLWEHNFTQYTRTFMWCCYAMAWGIETYDNAKEPIAA